MFHALTGSHEVHQWWEPLLEPGKPLDPARRPILAANLLGGCYGSSGPAPGDPSAEHFPDLTTGTSPGPTASCSRSWASPGSPWPPVVRWAAWWRSSGPGWPRCLPRVSWSLPRLRGLRPRPLGGMPRSGSPSKPIARWQGGHYAPGEGPAAGLAAARAIAMITYRSAIEFETRFGRRQTSPGRTVRCGVLPAAPGDKLVARFDAASYVSLMRSMDLHDVGDTGVAAEETRLRVNRLIGVGIDTDILYYPAEVEQWVASYAAAGVDARYREIKSPYGHDAFLTEWDQVVGVLQGGVERGLRSFKI